MFFFGKLANVLLKNFITTHWEHFEALIQHTDGCTEVLWLLVQTHHSIRCSHKRYKNRHFYQHMIFGYCDKGSGEPVRSCRLPRAFCQYKRSWYLSHCPEHLPAQMCRLTRVFAAGVSSTQIVIFGHHKRFCTVTKAKVSLCKCADSPEPSLLALNGIQSPFEPPHANFGLWRRLRLDQANVQAHQSHRCWHEWHPKIVSEHDREISQLAYKPMTRGIATQQSQGTSKTE